MRILLAPDKFKEALSAQEVCAALAQGFQKAATDLRLLSFPMADGGDGTALLLSEALKADIRTSLVQGPGKDKVLASWGWLKESKTALLDMAEASGLRHLPREAQSPLHTSTYGCGELMASALKAGATTLYMGMGGSATNDGGCGALAALGFRFLDESDQTVKPTGANLIHIHRILFPESIRPFTLNLLFDVQTVFSGRQGAVASFATQKGADETDRTLLEAGMQNLRKVWLRQTGTDLETIPGSGAAGGLAGGLHTALDARLLPGAATFARLGGLDAMLEQVELVISGEGKLDESSLQGKVVGYLAERCQQLDKPLWVICGQNQLTEAQARTAGIRRIIPLHQHPARDFRDTAQRLTDVGFAIGRELKKRP